MVSPAANLSTIMAQRRTLLLMLLALVAAVALCGGCLRRSGGKMSDLFISDQRYIIDETRERVRVYGRLDNTGHGHFHQVEIEIALVSKAGGSRGENSVILQNIQPLEKRVFAADVTSHGRVSGVELKIREPKAP